MARKSTKVALSDESRPAVATSNPGPMRSRSPIPRESGRRGRSPNSYVRSARFVGTYRCNARRLHRDTIPPRVYVSEKALKDMGHTIREKAKLLARVRRLRGQIEAVERALDEEKGCTEVLHLVVAARGAMNSLMAEILEGHIREHVIDPARERNSSRAKGAEELIEAVQSYLR